jgi:hypothetical protein
MLISVPIIVLGSHLVTMVADNVPRFDIARNCRLDNAAASDLTEEASNPVVSICQVGQGNLHYRH